MVPIFDIILSVYRGSPELIVCPNADLFAAATVLLVLDFEVQDPIENASMERSVKQAISILEHMRARSSMALSYVTMLEKAKEGLRAAHGDFTSFKPSTSSSSAMAIQAHHQNTHQNLASAAYTGGPSPMADSVGLDDFLRTDTGSGNAVMGWNMQDFYAMPWDMAVDNPMPSFTS